MTNDQDEEREMTDAEPEHDIMCFCLRCAPNQRCEPGRVILAMDVAADAEFSPEDEARLLVFEGFQQTSGKYRQVARVPRGKSGLEALLEADPKAHARIMQKAEAVASDHYRRCCAEGDDKRALSPEVFKAFRKAGGEPSTGWKRRS